MTSLELLKEIEAWLSFNTEPSKEETAKLRNSIKEHVTEQLRIHYVIGWVAVSERTPKTNDLCLCSTECGYSFRYWEGNHFEGEHVVNEPKVTHWMYAPEPPYL
jgi:hypothetical protein